MRIISSFKDYYDIGLQHGIDPNIIYERESKWLDESIKILDVEEVAGFPLLNVSTFAIGFCGKVYPGVTVSVQRKVFSLNNNPKFVFYSREELADFIANNFDDVKNTQANMRRYYGRRSNKHKKTSPEQMLERIRSEKDPKYLPEICKHLLNPYPELLPIFESYRVPIFTVQTDKIDHAIEINAEIGGRFKEDLDKN